MLSVFAWLWNSLYTFLVGPQLRSHCTIVDTSIDSMKVKALQRDPGTISGAWSDLLLRAHQLMPNEV